MSEKFDAIDDELLEAIAKVKGHAVQKAEPMPVSKLYPVTAAVWKNPAPGQQMPDGTIYVGKYSPADRDGISLGQTFNVFAARKDLPGDPQTYLDTVARIAKLKNWNGYAGAGYADDAELYKAIREGAYDGKWIIPTLEILSGENADRKMTTPDNLLVHKDAGALKGTFNMIPDNRLAFYSTWYWSCTEKDEDRAYIIHFDGGCRSDNKDHSRLSCRPVRLEPCP